MSVKQLTHTYLQLIDQLDDALKFTLTVEEKKDMADIVNYEAVRDDIKRRLEELRDNPQRNEGPLIYHLDVAAMYPNIILTNRLQPDAMIDESMCAQCEFNVVGKTCDRRMPWSWRGEFFPTKRNEFNMIENQLASETFPARNPKEPPRAWHQLSPSEQTTLLHSRLSAYSRKVYRKIRETKTMERTSIICQRENPFYIETVRAFRDRRYEYKGLHKVWKQNMDKAASATEVEEAKKMIVLYDSLQLAHKCILNSFYGYVMRKGARWHSLEMAGIVCLTGARIIQMARELVERIGRPLELDTDGIWCILPKSFPETFAFELANGKKCKIDYPCTMLNHLVHAQFTNHQYQDRKEPGSLEYTVHSENSIFFEIDGPYRAMILPASTVEDKLLKKRYAVFNDNGSLAELKGFEVKRRGELKLVKDFQESIFKVFLKGSTLEECYATVAQEANRWLDILYSKAIDLRDEELFELISENRSMSKTLEEYGAQKSSAISTARRLAEFLGDEMVKDKGLACKFVISERPFGLPVSERAIPVTIFSADPSVKQHYLRKWLKDNSLTSFDIRDIIDWGYYLERFGSVIQKLITIPAAMQRVDNPVPRVRHPDWLYKRVAEKENKYKQRRISDIFARSAGPAPVDRNAMDVDIEDLHVGHKRNSQAQAEEDEQEFDDAEEDMPDPLTDFSAYRDFKKQGWLKRLKKRAKHRAESGDVITQPRNRGLGFFGRQTGSLVASTWEVLQLVETDVAGEFRLWVSIQGQLHCIRLNVPRTFYINTRDKEAIELQERYPMCEMQLCSRTLPRSHPSMYLYQVSMPEEDFEDEKVKMASIFNDWSTEGIYETQLPLETRALLELGAHCEVDKSVAGRRRLDETFGLKELKAKANMSHQYMMNPRQYNFIYLYHAQAENRHLYVLVGATLEKSRCYVVGVSANSGQMPNMKRVYADMREQHPPENDTVEIKPDMDFEATYHTSEEEALRALQRTLIRYKDMRNVQSILIISSSRPARQLAQYAKSINEFPNITLPIFDEPRKAQAQLAWLQPAARRAMRYYMNLPKWLEEKIQQASYGNVPIGNIPDDSFVFLADIIFSRQLVKNDMVLWWSEDAKPDFGGREQDDNQTVLFETEDPEICHPGTHTAVCFEVDIARLCFNTLMEAHVINEIEGTTGMLMDFDVQAVDEQTLGAISNVASFGDGTIPSKTFMVLRNMVQYWLKETNGTDASRKAMSEHMIDVLHRWISSNASHMFDPSLYSLVHNMMKKIFLQLVAEFQRLGATVVYGNFQHMVVATNKDSMASAIQYREYLFRSISEKPIFELLKLNLIDYWALLTWMDEFNHGGVIVTEEQGDEVLEKPEVVMQWNIIDFLPEVVHKAMKVTIASYLHQMYKNKIAHPRDVRSFADDGDTLMSEQAAAKEEETPRALATRAWVRDTLATQLSQWIPWCVKMQGNGKGTDFPQPPGAYLQMHNVALECVKTICAIISLDATLQHDVTQVKRDVLRLIRSDLSDFSDEAQFRNPCATFKLRSFFCTFCNYATDLDVCRDAELLRDWQCKACKKPYDLDMIEHQLESLVGRALTTYQLQDLECERCHRLKDDNLMKHCNQCGGAYRCTLSRADTIQTFKVLGDIAKKYGFDSLLNSVQWTLNHM